MPAFESSTALRVSWYRLRSTARSRLGSYLALILLIGLVAGVAMAALTAGRRTQSSYPAFLKSTNPSDMSVSVYDPMTGQPVADIASAIAGLPGVAHVRTVVAPPAFPIGPNGAPIGAGPVSAGLASADGEFVDQDRPALVSGHRADQSRPDQVVLDPTAARLLGVRVGSVVPLGLYSPEQMALPQFGTAAVKPIYRVDARVVGIVKANSQLVQDDIDQAYGLAYLTEAYVRHAIALEPGDAAPVGYAIQLAGGSRGVPAAEVAVRKVIPSGATYQFHVVSRTVTDVELALRPESLALGGFGVIAALVALLIATQVISRQIRSEDAEREVIRALGAGVSMTTADSFCGIMVAVVLGALAAVGVAVGLSPLGPLGPIRPYYPGRGTGFDWTVEGTGFGVLLIVLGGTALLLARSSAGRREVQEERIRATSSQVAEMTQAAGLPLPSQVGIMFAVDPGRGRTAVPVRSVLVGGVTAVALVVATLMFASSMQTLVSHPALYGWDWSYVLDPSNNVPLQTLTALDHDPDVVAWSGVDYNNIEIDGQEVPVLISRPGGKGLVGPPILSGHRVTASNQIVIGASTLAELHRHVGQSVTVSYGSAGAGALRIPPTTLRIVGTATFPAVGFESFVADHTSMGTGAIFSQAILPRSFQAAVSNPDPNLAGPELVLVRMRPGLSEAAGRSDMGRLADAASRLFAADRNAAGNTVIVLGVQRPAQIVDYRSIGAAPVTLSIGLAAGALAGLGLMLRASVRRRRRDLALLKTLGFTKGQLSGAVAWQATVSALIAVAIGIPLGIGGGSVLWRIFARTLDVVPDPTVPVASVVLVAVGAIVFCNLVAVPSGRAAARVPTATLLRTE